MIPWGIWSEGTQLPRIEKGALSRDGMPISLGNFTWGCQIPGKDEFPVTPQPLS